MTVQSTPRKSVAKQAATARRLNAHTGIAQHVLDATVDFPEGSPAVIEKTGRYYTVWYVQSSKFAGRYYVVIWDNERNAYKCSCGAGCKTHRHTVEVSEQNKPFEWVEIDTSVNENGNYKNLLTMCIALEKDPEAACTR